MSKSAAAAANPECVQVVIRCRPLSSDEKKNNNKVIVRMDKRTKQVAVDNPTSGGGKSAAAADAGGPRTFTFDGVYDMSTTQVGIYEETCNPLVQSVLSGYNGTIFAYGQTGTGKTFTMDGGDGDLKGMTPRAFEQIFRHIDGSADEEWLVRGSYLEIYNDDVLDLLGDAAEKLEVKENPDTGVYVKGLQSFVVKSVSELQDLLNQGKKNRKTGSTLMNRESSRSHSIFIVKIENSKLGPDGQPHIKTGALNLVDLAGSERASKTGAEGDRLKEGAKINLALSALGNVISALTNPKVAFIPYRDSKLTRLLQDSLGGNTKTVMCANIGPSDYNFDETINTLRFANRAKNIKNKPKINEDPKDAMLREFQNEIERLKAQLAMEEAIASGQPVPEELKRKLAAAGPANPAALAAMGFAPGALPPQKIVVNKVVEKVIEKGISQSEIERLKAEAEEKKAKLEESASAAKAALLQEEEKLKSKGENMERELHLTKEEIEQRRQDRLALKSKLKAVEAKLLVGKKILDAAEKQQLAIQRNKEELILAERERERVEAQLRAREQEQLDLAEKYESLDKDVASKTAKLDKLTGKYQELKQEIEDTQSENQREREELMETIRELTRQVQLKDFLLENFVPKDEHRKVEARAIWDDEKEQWKVQPTDFLSMLDGLKRPIAVKETKKPTTEWSKAQALMLEQEKLNGNNSPSVNALLWRFRNENILDLELDMPDRTTQDWNELQERIHDQMAQQHRDRDRDRGDLFSINLNSMHSHTHVGIDAAQQMYLEHHDQMMRQMEQQMQAESYGGGSGRPRTAKRESGRPQSRMH